MSFEPLKRVARSAGVRLSLWFAVIFISSVAGLFGLLYFLLASTIDRGERAALQSYLKEFAGVYRSQGLGALRDRVYEDTAPPAEKSLFSVYVFILLSAQVSGAFARSYIELYFLAMGIGIIAAKRSEETANSAQPVPENETRSGLSGTGS